MNYYLTDDNGNITSHAQWNFDPFCEETEEDIIRAYDGRYYIASMLPERPLDQFKEQKLALAGAEFAKRRDEIRWVGGYGFDCANDDVVNFMAAFTPLLVNKSGRVFYKVWIDDQNKGVVDLTYEQMQVVYDMVRAGQMEAYVWYESIKQAVEAAQSADELNSIVW